MNPLLYIVLGVLIYKERLRPIQWFSVVLAGVGITVLSIVYGTIPWIALSLAASFGLYGVMKKSSSQQAINGLFLETIALIVPAAAYLLWGVSVGQSSWISASLTTRALLVGTGLVTTVPLVLFALAEVRMPLTQLGFLQYLTPTLQLFLGVYLYHEPFTRPMQLCFACIWVALALNWMPYKNQIPSPR